MKKNYIISFALCLLLSFIFQGQNVYSQKKSGTKNKSLAGSWQYPKKTAWIYISENKKTAFQCILNNENKIYYSAGTIKGKKIIWENYWKPYNVKFQKGKLSLKGNTGNFSFIRTDNIPKSICQPKSSTHSGFGSGRTSDDGEIPNEIDNPQIQTENYSPPTPKDALKIKGRSTPLKIISRPRPGYTEAARSRGVSGRITLQVQFLANGSIGSITPVKGLPSGLTEKAMAAARRIRFIPETKYGNPVSVTKMIKYNFLIY